MQVCFYVALLVLTSAGASAQQFKNPDNLGPDIPTPQNVVDRMLDAAKLLPGETLFDLGCGDGRILITAVQKFKAHAVGVEMSEPIYEKTLAHVKKLGLSDQIRMVRGNALDVDLRTADVVTLYLLTSSNERLKPLLEKQMHPGARVVSHDYEIRGWSPVTVQKVAWMGRTHTVFVYEMPPRL
jgi:precorrin-6B methylase 2